MEEHGVKEGAVICCDGEVQSTKYPEGISIIKIVSSAENPEVLCEGLVLGRRIVSLVGADECTVTLHKP